MPQVHARGIPCHVNRRRWSSMTLSSTGDPEKVTCMRCRKALARASRSWRDVNRILVDALGGRAGRGRLRGTLVRAIPCSDGQYRPGIILAVRDRAGVLTHWSVRGDESFTPPIIPATDGPNPGA